ncbi:adenosylmethionine--8-amino-7-oxononanoate transaminase [Hydrogenophaga sp. SNF1]|uniref:adenosylmethionine--8-amino-7-oxononanoate transaminase n=1 Tax=Hydrogenophaga sp. SNF1 TaxID=3098762 RepID=UPI002ACC14D7|nr:adenosylmethionine--8-amino-7-oxononanoate transaminase [Hydrogenophaga sp. SNF1]WQB84161.1 adenosylmethionine--8-amino-7-oxononanoate transaminase [Hydrogenophaga sp. SNF1]
MTNNGSLMPELAARSLARVWHPCTSMARAAQRPPLPLARGEGPWLFDSEGRRYFDAISSWWVNLFGHSDEGLRAAITAQLNTLPHAMLAGCTHEPVVRLAERLCARTGGALAHASFGSDGASAVEIALKQSFHAWRNQGRAGKRGFVALRGGYHGETLGALSVTDVAIFRDAYDPLLMRSRLVDAPDSRLGNQDQALAALAALLASEADQLAAVLIEPLVQGAAGMVMHSPDYLRELRRLCTAHGVHLIADEIAVGCGRTGRFFAWSHTEPAGPADWPDFLLLSKGITGGTLPLSVALGSEAVFQAFWSDDPTRAFLHSHSYTGNPLACAAANAVLDRFDAGQEARCAEQAAWLAQAFAPLAQDPRVAHLRQRGTILAFDLPGAAADVAERFHLAGRAHGLLIRPIGRTVYLMPPYLVDPPTAAWLAEAVSDTLNDVV